MIIIYKTLIYAVILDLEEFLGITLYVFVTLREKKLYIPYLSKHLKIGASKN